MENFRPGWLAPNGEFFPCRSYEHIAVASYHADKANAPSIDPKTHRIIPADDRLFALGWTYIGITEYPTQEWRITWSNDLTPEQVSFLKPYFDDGGGLQVEIFARMRWATRR